MKLRALLSVSTVLVCAACATNNGLRPLPDVSALPAVDRSGKGRVVDDELVVRFSLVDGVPLATERAHRVVRIEGARSKSLADLVVVYSRTFSQVTTLAARSRTPDGTLKTYARDDASDFPAFGDSVLYTDNRVLMHNLPELAAGTLVEHASEVTNKEPTLFVWDAWFGAAVPVDAQRFVIEAPADWRIDWLTEEGGVVVDLAPVKAERDGMATYTWARANLPAMLLPSRAPARGDIAQRVTVRLASWKTAEGVVMTAPADDKEDSRFNAKISEGRDDQSPELVEQVHKALAGVDGNQRAQARRLYAWVRDSVRYCAIEVGMGGWVPHTATEVFAARAGDCKDKANLLKSMLDVVGIESHLVAIRASAWPSRYRLPVLVGNFNHAILAIELPADQGGRVFVDPTSRVAAFGAVPDSDRDRRALLIDDGTGLVDMPASSAEHSRREERYELTLGADGTATGTFAVTFTGEAADDVRARLLSEPRKRYDDVIGDAMMLWRPRVDDLGLAIEQLAPPEEPTPVVARGKLSVDVARGTSSVVVRARSFFFGGPARRFSEDTRDVDALLGARVGDKAELLLRLPAGLRVSAVPADAVVNSKFGRYQRSFSIEEGGAVLVLRREAARDEVVLPAASYAEYRQWANAVLLADEAAVVLEAVSR